MAKILVTCAKGISGILAEELKELGFPVLDEKQLGVFTEGSFNDTIKLNFHLRTGLRVLYHLKDFNARTPDDMYKHVRQVPWEDYLSEHGYFSITSSVSNKNIRDTRFANLKCKDAVVDRMQEKFGRRPDSGPDRSKAVLFLYWRENEGAIYLDTSGEPLAKRGYRKMPYKAPMQECLAAALILSTGWKGESAFVNPMCGSGTLAIEAALIAADKAPGLLRTNFGFMHLKPYDANIYKEVRLACRKQSKGVDVPIIATDISKDAIFAAQRNAETAGVHRLLTFDVCDYSETKVPGDEGIVVLNPEYGVRLNEERRLEPVYQGIGDFFKQSCNGYMGYVFTGNLELGKKVGLKTKSKKIFYNGPIECRLLEYELYSGTRKINKAGSE